MATDQPRAESTPAVQLNPNLNGLRASATVAINERSNRLLSEGRKVYKLGLGQSPFPVPEQVVEALRCHAAQKDYLPVAGLAELRTAVAEFHRRRDGLDRGADDLLIGPGSKELMFILQLVFDGDLLLPSPAWVSYAPQASLAGRAARWIHTPRATDWKLVPKQLEAACVEAPDRPCILLLNYPSNPTGQTYDAAELEALARVSRAHRIIVLSDEIYGEIDHAGEHVSMARFYPEGTILSAGLSKWCGAGGWRLGTFSFPPQLGQLREAIRVVASETFTSVSAPIQYAAVPAFEGGPEIERYLATSRRVLGALGGWCAERLLAAGLEVARPRGGFYLFPDLSPVRDRLAARGLTTSAQLCEALLEETGVAILPGDEFGRRPEELLVRLAYVDFDGARALALAEAQPDGALDEAYLREATPRVLTAIDRLCAWATA